MSSDGATGDVHSHRGEGGGNDEGELINMDETAADGDPDSDIDTAQSEPVSESRPVTESS